LWRSVEALTCVPLASLLNAVCRKWSKSVRETSAAGCGEGHWAVRAGGGHAALLAEGAGRRRETTRRRRRETRGRRRRPIFCHPSPRAALQGPPQLSLVEWLPRHLAQCVRCGVRLCGGAAAEFCEDRADQEPIAPLL